MMECYIVGVVYLGAHKLWQYMMKLIWCYCGYRKLFFAFSSCSVVDHIQDCVDIFVFCPILTKNYVFVIEDFKRYWLLSSSGKQDAAQNLSTDFGFAIMIVAGGQIWGVPWYDTWGQFELVGVSMEYIVFEHCHPRIYAILIFDMFFDKNLCSICFKIGRMGYKSMWSEFSASEIQWGVMSSDEKACHFRFEFCMVLVDVKFYSNKLVCLVIFTS